MVGWNEEKCECACVSCSGTTRKGVAVCPAKKFEIELKQCELDTTLLVAEKKKFTYTPVDKEDEPKSQDASLDRIIEDAHEAAAEKSDGSSANSQLIPERVSTDPDSSDNSSDSEEEKLIT